MPSALNSSPAPTRPSSPAILAARAKVSELVTTSPFFRQQVSYFDGYSDLFLAYLVALYGPAELALELADASAIAMAAGEIPVSEDAGWYGSVRALALSIQGTNLDEAVRVACVQLETDPEDATARFGLAIGLAKQMRLEEARAQFDWLVATQEPESESDFFMLYSPMLFYAGKTYRLLAYSRLEQQAPYNEIADLCSRALSLVSGNSKMDLLRIMAMHDEEAKFASDIWGRAAYAEAMRVGSTEGALSVLRAAESRIPLPSPAIIFGLAELNIDRARRTGDPRAAQEARTYIQQARTTGDFLDWKLDEMLASLPC